LTLCYYKNTESEETIAMKKTSALLLALVIGCTGTLSLQMAYSQNSKLEWSSASAGFGLQASATSGVGSSVGEGIVGGSRLANTEIESGFIAGLLFRGVGAAVPEPPTGLPVSFSLSQNYPNPFNPFTIIKYTIAGAGGSGLGAKKTSLVVYDVLGRQVATLVNEEKAPGSYEVRFDGSTLASGVYFYRMQAGDFVDTKKFVLLK
jgi:hypothetical protein